MQSIYTEFKGPTNHRGSRIIAKASGFTGEHRKGLSLTVSYDHAADPDGNHMMAAKALAERLGWAGEWVEGGAPGGRGNVYVLKNGDSFTVTDYQQIARDAGWAPVAEWHTMFKNGTGVARHLKAGETYNEETYSLMTVPLRHADSWKVACIVDMLVAL